MSKKNQSKEDEYLEGLRIIIKQAEREKWNTFETSMAVWSHRFALDMKWNDKQPVKGVINDT